MEMSEFRIVKIELDEDAGGPYVLLQEVEGSRRVRIHISLPDASVLFAAYQGIPFPRPLTHDLILDILNELGADVDRVCVVDLKDNIFYGRLVLRYFDREISIDCRPSDGMNIAVRANAPVYIYENVLKELEVLEQKEATKAGFMDLIAQLSSTKKDEEEEN